MAKNAHSFSVGEVWSSAFAFYRKHWLKLSILAAVVLAAEALVQKLFFSLIHTVTGSDLLIQLCTYSFVMLGVYTVVLKLARSQTGSVSDFITTPTRYLSFLWLNLSLAIRVGLGLLLFIVPGITWLITFSMAPLFMVDAKVSAAQAWEASKAMTAGVKWQLFGIGLVLGILQLLALIASGTGLVITAVVSLSGLLLIGLSKVLSVLFVLPLTWSVYVSVYLKLKSKVVY